MSTLKTSKYYSVLNDAQKKAVSITDGPLMVLAGAGSGKTKMLTSRVVYLIENKKIMPRKILAVTFTNKAAREMRERIYSICEEMGIDFSGSNKPEVGTFHAVCVRLLRREIDSTPFERPFTIYDDADQLSLIKSILKDLDLSDKQFPPKSIQTSINRAKCDAIDPDNVEFKTQGYLGDVLKDVFSRYQKALISNSALDFGEILCMTYRVLRDNEQVRSRYQKWFEYIHVDEYQDTNRVQYLILSLLASKKYGGHENICVVGDEDQSIYKWRGADIRNILEFEKDYPGAQVVKLEQNYRSTKTIIKSASHLIKNNTTRKDKTLWTNNEDGAPVFLFYVQNEREEAKITLDIIRQLIRDDGYTYSDFAVFYRMHAQSRQFEDALRNAGITYQLIGSLRFYDRKEIKDILAYLRVIVNPSDSVSLKRIINVPVRGIGKTSIDKLERILFTQGDLLQESLWNIICRAANNPGSIIAKGASEKLKQFVDLIDSFVKVKEEHSLYKLYEIILEKSGYLGNLKNDESVEAKARVEHLEELATVLQEFEEDKLENAPSWEIENRRKGLLNEFLEQVSLVTELDSEEGSKESFLGAVKLMTLHAAKGLEFPVVFLVGMEEGIFPSIRSGEEADGDKLEEERRICYVGMTRAKKRLFILHAEERRIWGRWSAQAPSRFLGELPENLIKKKTLIKEDNLSGYSKKDRYQKSHDENDDVYPSSNKIIQAKDWQYVYEEQNESVVGKSIVIPKYGKGRIVASEGLGAKKKITIEFAQKIRRKFIYSWVSQYLE